jgi:hypothetical protein
MLVFDFVMFYLKHTSSLDLIEWSELGLELVYLLMLIAWR